MGKQIYIRGSNYGGEMTIGMVTPEFVTFWQDRDQDELIDHLMALEQNPDNPEDEEGYDPDSPDIVPEGEYFNSWYEVDDIHHHNTSSGTELMAFDMVPTEEDAMPDYDWDTRVDFEPYTLYGRECYTQDEPADGEDDESVPVLVFYSAEKGDFGGFYVDLKDGEEFDKNKVAVSVVETDHGEMIERLWYNKEEIEQDYDFVDSRGKGYYANVAWFNKRWEDKHLQEGDDYWEDCWLDYEQHLVDAEQEEESVDK